MPDHDHRTSPARCLLAVLAAGTTALALGRHLAETLPRLTGAALAPDDVVVAGAAAVGALAAARLALGALLLLADHLLRAGGRTRPRLTAAARTVAPAALRRLVAAGVAAGIGMAGTTGALAAEPELGWVVTTGSTAAAATTPATTPLPAGVGADIVTAEPTAMSATPAPMTAVPATAVTPSPGTPTPTGTADTVVVAPGDTLWDLTAARLPGAGAAEIAAAWPAVHEANAATIGADPDVIHPGQVLDLGVLGGRA